MNKIDSMSAAVREVINAYPAKTPKILSSRIVKIEKIFRISRNFFENRLSLLNFRHDHFSMSKRANIRQPETPATERLLLGAEGELYDSDSRHDKESGYRNRY
jgi:hypothetical protein